MENYLLRRPRFHRHENFCLICMDFKSPLDDTKHAEMCRQVSEIISTSMYSETLFVSIPNLFLREFIFI